MRQAVVIIHGIGEQKPMSTLRGFVRSILGAEKLNLINPSKERDYWVMPDNISENYELRKITAKSNEERTTTDFFEYYWAHNMRNTSLGHIIPWFKTLLLVNPKNVSRRLMPVWLFSWLLIIATGYFVLSGFNQDIQPLKDTYSVVFSAGGAILSSILQMVVIRYIGDAARYLTPSPDNISERLKIRKNGIDLLRKIHESGRDYSRVIVVGHSLGSVIGYDIITHLWEEYRRDITIPDSPDKGEEEMLQPELYKLQEMVKNNASQEEYREQQRKVLEELRRFNNKWLITDFITVGSPLAHAQMLLAKSRKDFDSRVTDREFPTCPPQVDKYDNFAYQNYKNKGEDRKLWYLHHAAQFACIRWTNLYFTGDLIGGPVAPMFGKYVKDLKLKLTKRRWLERTPLTHTKYWIDDVNEDKIQDYAESEAIENIYQSMDLGYKVKGD
jgi:hypothetical protein